LVGPNCRTLLEKYAAILAYISETIKAIHGDIEAADFVQRHSSVIAPYRELRHAAGEGQRRRRALSEDEKNGAQWGVLGLWDGVEG
jgi:hypothetical protein